MGITRESIIRGPGAVKLGSTQIFDKEGIDAELQKETFDIPVSAYGNVDTRFKDVLGKVTFTPCGAVTAGILAALYPYGTPNLGADIFGSVDVPVEVHSLAGKKVLFAAGAITRMPTLRLSAQETLFGGQAEITTVIANGADRTTANSMYTISDAAFAGAFDVADVKCKPVSAAWGASAPWDAIKTKTGWTIDLEASFDPETIDEVGTIGMKLTGVTARARCQPLGVTEANIFDAMRVQGTGNAIGDSVRTGNNLVLIGTGGISVTLTDAALVQGPIKWGPGMLRAGELGWIAHRTVSAGVGGPVFTVAMTA